MDQKLLEILKDQPSYRQKQILQAVYVDLIDDWQQASTLPLSLREQLNQGFTLKIDAQLFAPKKADVIKALIKLHDGLEIETVLMKHKDGRNTVCVSSQVGCAMGCAFCATGKMGFKRNLTAQEIVQQVLLFSRFLKKEQERVSGVVFMGMGEPFMNYIEVMQAVQILHDESGLNIGSRHISISTVGVVVGIKKLIKENLPLNLAISLHAPNDKLRTSIMPSARKYHIKDILEAVDQYVAVTNRRVMFEYLMLDGVNDQPEHAKELVQLMKKKLYMVNLIRYNPTGNFQPSAAQSIQKFKQILQREKITVTQRYSFGQDIKAACGQLSLNNAKQK